MLPGPGLVLTYQGARAEEQQGPRKVQSKTLPPIPDTYLPNPVKSKESQRKLSYHLLVPSIHPSIFSYPSHNILPPPLPFFFFSMKLSFIIAVKATHKSYTHPI